MIHRSQFCPVIFFCSVVIGTRMMSSWSCPIAADVPFAVSSPTTLKGKLLMRIVCPIGSVGPNRFFLTVPPITAPFEAKFTPSSEKEVPPARAQLQMSKYCAPLPLGLVPQLSFPKPTCPQPGDLGLPAFP